MTTHSAGRLLAVGVDCDPTMVHFLRYCRRTGVDVDAVNLRQVAATGSWRLGIPSSGEDYIEVGDRRWDLADYAAVYSRPIDLTWQQDDPAARNRWLGMMAAVTAWLSCADVLVVNRPVGGAHNSAKSLHESLIVRLGLSVPISVSSADPQQLQAFSRSSETVAKAMGGGRGDTRLVTERNLGAAADDVPVHVQAYVAGRDVRAHVIGEKVFSVLIDSSAVDYRAPGARPTFAPWTLPADIEDKVVAGTAAFGLTFAGWDFKLDADGRYWCLEANPQPGYSMYDHHLDGAISAGLVDALTCSRRHEPSDTLVRS